MFFTIAGTSLPGQALPSGFMPANGGFQIGEVEDTLTIDDSDVSAEWELILLTIIDVLRATDWSRIKLPRNQSTFNQD